MARRKIREYDAKMLLARHLGKNAHSVQVASDTDFGRLAKGNPWLEKEKLVAKPDMLFGQRGKHNLVLLDATLQDAEKFVRERIGKEVEVNGAKGLVTHFLIEPFIPHEEEYYFSIQSTRDGTLVRFSSAGGVKVEESWGKMNEMAVPVGGEGAADFGAILQGLTEEKREKVAMFIRECHNAFNELDFTLLEMNPFTLSPEGSPLPLDMRVELDDTASYRNTKKWEGITFPQPFGRKLYPEEKLIREMDEKSGSSLKLTLLNPEGSIWTIVAGGGASVIYADTVVDLGYERELANYGEYSGNPDEDETYAYAKTILDLATRGAGGKPTAILIGGGIANFTDVAVTFKGIIRALREYKEGLIKAKARVFVRRGGPNYETGLKLMRELGRELGVPIEVYGPESSMTCIVPMAIKYVGGG